MYKSIMIVIIAMLAIGTSVQAEQQVHDTQAFIYYKIPFGGGAKPERQHQYGFRFDHSYIDQDKGVDLNQLMRKPAALDFNMSANSQPKLEIHGVDYLAAYLANRADAKASEGAEVTDETATEAEATEAATSEAETETVSAEPAEEEDTLTSGVMDSLSDVPVGIFIGIAILGAIAAGG